jgi:hypothetical protein
MRMPLPRETYVTLTVCAIAILFILGGYASLTGLATYDSPVDIALAKAKFSKGDVFDATVTISLITLFSDETIMIYLDGTPAGAVMLRQYMDMNLFKYTAENREGGEVLNMAHEVFLNLADYVSLESLAPGKHTVQVALSKAQVGATEEFVVE